MGQYAILAENGEVQEVDLMTWAKWYETANRQVALTEVEDVRVSTVFLGMAHRFRGGEPLWFETMCFGGAWEEYARHYATLNGAKEGHDELVELIQANPAASPQEGDVS